MTWQDQGRQNHMWFGQGTAGSKDKPSTAGSDPMFKPEKLDKRIDAVAHNSLMHLPRKEWHRPVLSFDRERLERLRTAMTTWLGARALSNAAFGAKLLDPLTTDAAINALRAAVEGAQAAQSHEDLKGASGQLAAGMQGVGLSKWPGFLRDAADRAKAYQPVNGRIVLAQAATNTAADASPGRAPANTPPAPPGRYVADNPRQWAGLPSVGTGECVPLVQQATGAPLTRQWRPGVTVRGNTAIRPGTAIATFYENGRYSGHAAIYLGQDENGVRVLDQWNVRHRDGTVSQHTPSERTLPFNDPRHARVDRGESYGVVE